MKNAIVFWLGIIGIAAGTALLIIFSVHLGVSWSCNGYSTTTGKETKVVALICYINTSEGWLAYNEYQNRFVATGVK